MLLDEDGCLTYTDHEPEQRILQQFFTRKDNQIASLEMLAIAYGWQPDAAICQLALLHLNRSLDFQRDPSWKEGDRPLG